MGCTDSSNKKSAKDILGGPVKVRPRNTHRGEHKAFGGLPWGLLGRASESRFPRTSSNMRTLKGRAGQGRKGRLNPPHREGQQADNKFEESLVWGTKPKNGLRAWAGGSHLPRLLQDHTRPIRRAPGPPLPTALFPKTMRMCVCTSQNPYSGLRAGIPPGIPPPLGSQPPHPRHPTGVFVEKGLAALRVARTQVQGPTVCDSESWGRGLMSPRAALSPRVVAFSGQEAHVHANARAQTRLGVYDPGWEARGSQYVRMWVWPHDTPHTHTLTDRTAEAQSGDPGYPRAQKLPKAKVQPLDVPCWLYLVRPSTPDAARKGCSQSDFSLPSSWVRETELFHLFPNDRTPRSWSASSEEPHPLGGGVRWTW